MKQTCKKQVQNFQCIFENSLYDINNMPTINAVCKRVHSILKHVTHIFLFSNITERLH